MPKELETEGIIMIKFFHSPQNLGWSFLFNIDDPEYQRVFTALDELKLVSLKPFFKEQCLQVTDQNATFSVFLRQ